MAIGSLTRWRLRLHKFDLGVDRRTGVKYRAANSPSQPHKNETFSMLLLENLPALIAEYNKQKENLAKIFIILKTLTNALPQFVPSFDDTRAILPTLATLATAQSGNALF